MVSLNPSQRYLSTRGGSYEFSFEAAVLKGLADDGGLFIPEEIPTLPSDWKTRWSGLAFKDLAVEICSMYISDDEIPRRDLQEIIDRSYSTFRSTPDVTPLKTLNVAQNFHVLELFHGPTFAFKDVALQFLGNLFEYFLERKNVGKSPQDCHKLTVVGATSGDTGSAAIYGLRGKKNISVFILFPDGKVSPIQEAQMTTVLDQNIHNAAISGTFDDCQHIVKKLFSDREFNSKFNLGAVNSINWARILAQIVYYFSSYLSLANRVQDSERENFKVSFAVPTGNFGDVLAGYYAKKMGLPIKNLIISTNENDILNRFWKSGKYEIKPVSESEGAGGLKEDGAKAHTGGVKETFSPAMDILVSSNFERLLWYLAFEKAEEEALSTTEKRALAGVTVNEWMHQLSSAGSFSVSKDTLKLAHRDFSSERVTDKETLSTIKDVYEATKSSGKPYVLDPHSSIGITAALRHSRMDVAPGYHHICLATAHPAKFSHAVGLALQNEDGYSYEEIQPPEFAGLSNAEKRVLNLKEADANAVKAVIERIGG